MNWIVQIYAPLSNINYTEWQHCRQNNLTVAAGCYKLAPCLLQKPKWKSDSRFRYSEHTRTHTNGCSRGLTCYHPLYVQKAASSGVQGCDTTCSCWQPHTTPHGVNLNAFPAVRTSNLRYRNVFTQHQTLNRVTWPRICRVFPTKPLPSRLAQLQCVLRIRDILGSSLCQNTCCPEWTSRLRGLYRLLYAFRRFRVESHNGDGVTRQMVLLSTS
jgi:hypothetical protein